MTRPKGTPNHHHRYGPDLPKPKANSEASDLEELGKRHQANVAASDELLRRLKLEKAHEVDAD